MYDWIDLALARQRQEELLREAHERRKARSSRRTPSRERMTSRVRLLMRSLKPERNGRLATAEKRSVPIQGGCID